MRILLSISKKHFNPHKDIFIPHSAGVISRLFYEAVSDMGEVDIIDSQKNIIRGEKYDFLLGLPRNFKFLTDNNKFRKTFCFPNVAEGVNLRHVMISEAKKLGCKLSDCFSPSGYYDADHFFIIGGDVIAGQFEQFIPKEKITKLFYSMGTVPFKPRPKNKKTVFLHLATTLGLRKGTWHVVNDFKKTDIDAELWLIGKPQKEKFWIDFIQDAKKDSRIKWLGWIENTHPLYKNYIHSSDFIVFPSLGEGQPGTVTEAMEGGCLPIITPESGISYSVFEYEKGNSGRWLEYHNMGEEIFLSWQNHMKGFMDVLFDNNNFKQTVRRKIDEVLG